MSISHKIRQHRALLGFALPGEGEAPRSAEWGQGSRAQAGNMAGFYAPNSGWLPSWGLGIGLLEQSGNLPLVVPWFYVSRPFRVVVRLPICPTPPILTLRNVRTAIFNLSITKILWHTKKYIFCQPDQKIAVILLHSHTRWLLLCCLLSFFYLII